MPKFLKTTSERVSHALDVLDAFGVTLASKGGRAKADKNAPTLEERDEKIRADFALTMKAKNAKRHVIVASLAKSYKLSAYRINRILRAK